jgi:hypothetical protein
MTQPRRITFNQSVAGAVLTAGGYIGFFQLNDWLFQSIQVSEHINWIFLPAAVRMISVLLFGWAGVLGLFLGSVGVILPMLAEDPARAVSLAVLSSVLPMAAALSVRHFLDVPEDLAGMSGKQLLSVGLAGGLFNSVGHNIYFAAHAGNLEALHGIVPMFVGDSIGTLIMLYTGALLLRRLRLPAV